MSGSDVTLTERVMAAVESHLAESNGGGLLTGLVVVAEFADTDGVTANSICVPPEQPASRSIGLCEFGSELFRMEARQMFAVADACDCEDDD